MNGSDIFPPDRRDFLRMLAAGAPALLAAEAQLMITGELKSWRSNPALKPLAAAFRFLERPDLADLPLGKHVIDEHTYAMIDKSRSQPPESVQFEAHRKYVDVHYLIAGQVITGFAPATSLKSISPYEPAQDAESFAVPARYTQLKLSPGRFAVFFPGGGHMPNCHWDGPHDLHKVVVKVEHQRHNG